MSSTESQYWDGAERKNQNDHQESRETRLHVRSGNQQDNGMVSSLSSDDHIPKKKSLVNNFMDRETNKTGSGMKKSVSLPTSYIFHDRADGHNGIEVSKEASDKTLQAQKKTHKNFYIRALWLVLVIQCTPLLIIYGWVSIPIISRSNTPDPAFVFGFVTAWATFIALFQLCWMREWIGKDRLEWGPSVFNLILGTPLLYAILSYGFGVWPVLGSPITIGITMWTVSGVLWSMSFKFLGQGWHKVWFVTQLSLAGPPMLFLVCSSFLFFFQRADETGKTFLAISYPFVVLFCERTMFYLAHKVVSKSSLLFGFVGSSVGDIFGMMLFPNIEDPLVFVGYLAAEQITTSAVTMIALTDWGYSAVVWSRGDCCAPRSTVLPADFTEKDLQVDNEGSSVRRRSSVLTTAESVNFDNDDDDTVDDSTVISGVLTTFLAEQNDEILFIHDITITREQDKKRYRKHVLARFGLGMLSKVVQSISFIAMVAMMRFGNNGKSYSFFSTLDIASFQQSVSFALINGGASFASFVLVNEAAKPYVGLSAFRLTYSLIHDHLRISVITMMFILMFPILIFNDTNQCELLMELIYLG